MRRNKSKGTGRDSFNAVQGDEKKSPALDGVNDIKEYDIEKAQKEFTDLIYFQRKQRFNLLGNFVEGNYIIQDSKILENLLLVPKKFETQEGDAIYASTKLNSFVLNFKIELDTSYPFCKAKLSIIEIEQGIDEDVKHTTELERVVEDFSLGFREKIFEKWGIYYDDQVVVKNDYLQVILHNQHEEFLFNNELMEILSQLYMLRMLKLLDNLGEAGEKIRHEYQILFNEKLSQHPELSQEFAQQKVLLDTVLMRLNALPQILKTEEGRAIFKSYATPVKNLRDKNFESLTEALNTKLKEKSDKKPSKDSVIKWGSTLSRPATKPSPKIDWSKIYTGPPVLVPLPAVIQPVQEKKPTVTTVEREPVPQEISPAPSNETNQPKKEDLENALRMAQQSADEFEAAFREEEVEAEETYQDSIIHEADAIEEEFESERVSDKITEINEQFKEDEINNKKVDDFSKGLT